ncbi:MAG TPA: hypothetical protein PLS00_06075 [Niabella sp.]|nr:hypothetical protein [Niabella sp.]HUN02404.1 hypothetical protein [Niabella sp.]
MPPTTKDPMKWLSAENEAEYEQCAGYGGAKAFDWWGSWRVCGEINRTYYELRRRIKIG